MSIKYNEKRTSSLKKIKNEIKQNLTKPQTLEEYFLIIGVDPKISTKEYLYNTSIEELNDYYSKNDLHLYMLSLRNYNYHLIKLLYIKQQNGHNVVKVLQLLLHIF